MSPGWYPTTISMSAQYTIVEAALCGARLLGVEKAHVSIRSSNWIALLYLPIGLRRVAAAGIAAASVAKQKVKVEETRDRGVSDDTGERQMRGQKELR